MDAEREDRVLAHAGRAIKLSPCRTFTFSRKLKLWSFYVVVTQGMTTKFTKKLEARVELPFYFLFFYSFTHLFLFRFFLFVARWGMTPPTVNAYYSSIENKIGKYSISVTVVQCLYLSAGYRMGNFVFLKKRKLPFSLRQS